MFVEKKKYRQAHIDADTRHKHIYKTKLENIHFSISYEETKSRVVAHTCVEINSDPLLKTAYSEILEEIIK